VYCSSAIEAADETRSDTEGGAGGSASTWMGAIRSTAGDSSPRARASLSKRECVSIATGSQSRQIDSTRSPDRFAMA
jgi:hypothetical protein